jgi:hypothetical protein
MAKKIMRLTESDLIRLVKKVVKEQFDDNDFEFNTKFVNDRGDLEQEHGDSMIFIQGKSSRQVKRVISNLTEKIAFIAILDCEYADFSDINLCEYPKLVSVRLVGTPNNLEETQDNCYEEIMKSQYQFNYGN